MTPEEFERSAEQVRPHWDVTPLDGVGPLRFGMTVEEVAAALPDARELRRFQADPTFAEVVGVELGWQPTVPALYGYFLGSGQLFCVAADAVHGPLMSLDGTQLTGRNPAELDRWLFDLSDSMGGSLRYGPRANPGIEELGLVLRAQNTTEGVLSRPVLVGREWAERCVDDWEGVIPECEWVGRLWPDPRYSDRREVWPFAEDSPTWYGKWSPPF
ncbi:hypothetical protein Ari01nite_99130 [Paractinoplanes rishiriensis]|uniref:Uncharacterized protein n=2 Tax=Paractinoplanes rishiriensis TaxID=1050105 RepID=A0A919K9F6_9ACTN|nr:hypothetical protein Ari01nite_99130 [Actinoplanes rishiriensis]